MNKKTCLLMYHYTRYFTHSCYPKKGLDMLLLRWKIDFLNNYFDIMTMKQVIDAVEGKSELPEKSLLLTFDDDYIYALPFLEGHRVQGSFLFREKLLRNIDCLMKYNSLYSCKCRYLLAC